MAAVTIYSDFGTQKSSLLLFHIVSPSFCHEVMGPDTMILVFCMLSIVFFFPLPPPLHSIPLVFPVHQARALVSCIPPGLVICFTINNIHAVLSKHPTLAFSHRVQKSVLYICVSFSALHIGLSLPSF